MKELEDYIEQADNLIRKNGYSYENVDALFKASILAKRNDNVELMFQASNLAKYYIDDALGQQTGGDIWTVEKWLRDNGRSLPEIDLYYNILKQESFDSFESFIYSMERPREYKKRFYQPRRCTLKTVVQDFQDLEDGVITRLAVSMPSRTGKLLSDDTDILTKDGWKKHGELRVGDYVVGLNGEWVKVTYVHPKGVANRRVWFTDGTHIDCHENHEWVVYDRHRQREVTVETKDFAKCMDVSGGKERCRYQLPLMHPIKGVHQDFELDPYTLGAWLGDGRNTNPDITNPKCDHTIIEHIVENGYEISWSTTHKDTGVDTIGFKGLRFHLQKYGMCHSRKTTPKHIPEEYIYADLEQRLELLAGLLDTDGCLVKKENRYQFSTTEPQLRDTFIQLIHTFGWRVCLTEQEPKLSSSGIQGRKTVYTISFNPTMYIPCQVERKQLRTFSKQKRIGVCKLEEIEPVSGNCITVDGGIYRAGTCLKPTHNSTTFLMFLAWIGMKRPNSHNAYGGHSGILAKGSYKEIMNFLTTSEYAFWELYNYWHSNLDFIQDKSADEFTVNLGEPDRFSTLTFRGIDGTWTGAVDVSQDGYLCVDDLVRDREHSLSPIRMENTYQEYQNKMLDRMNDGAKLCLIGTLWNVLDPIERERQKHEHDPRWRFRKIPALDENDESNFKYEINGFSTQYYREMRDRLEPAEWMAKFQQQPFVREGLLFAKDRFRWFNGFTPDNERKVMAVCDPAFGGHDKLSMPILYIDVPTQDKYVIDWVYKSGTQNITVPMIVRAIIRHYITELHIEQNSGGKLITDSIEKEMKAQGVTHCKIIRYYASTKIPKEERIKAYSDYVLDNFQFLMENQYLSEDAPYRRTEMYDQAVGEMNMYTSEGKNSWDDGCDSITKMAEILGQNTNGKVEVINNPFKYGMGGYY